MVTPGVSAPGCVGTGTRKLESIEIKSSNLFSSVANSARETAASPSLARRGAAAVVACVGAGGAGGAPCGSMVLSALTKEVKLWGGSISKMFLL